MAFREKFSEELCDWPLKTNYEANIGDQNNKNNFITTLFMPEESPFSLKKGQNVDPKDFEQFEKDLHLLLIDAFRQNHLSAILGIDKSNLKNRLIGKIPITPKFIIKFNNKLGNIIEARRAGKSVYQIMQEFHLLDSVYEPADGPTLLDIMLKLEGIESSNQRIEQALGIKQAPAPEQKPDGPSETDNMKDIKSGTDTPGSKTKGDL